MKLAVIINILLFVCSICFSQQFQYETSIGKFNNATSFYINSTGNLFVTDDFKNEVYQLDTVGNIVNSIGGFGTEIETFDDPVDVFADPLSVFVTDKNNHRIQMFDKNLNFIFEFSSKETDNEDEQFRYPVSTAQSTQGDVLILDSENKKVLKFNLFGDFIQNFGGYDYGNYSLSNPRKLAVSMKNNVYVLDEEGIFIYDSYGTGIGTINTSDEIISIRIIFNNLTINSKDKIYLTDLKTKDKKLSEVKLIGYKKDIGIVSTIIFYSKLYILTHNNILVFNRIGF